MKMSFTIQKLFVSFIGLILSQGSMAQNNTITNVETLELISRQLNVHSSYVGHLRPKERVVIKAEAEGTVEQVYFEEGQAINTEDSLVNISTERLALSVKLAKANYALAESEYKTEKLLFDQQISTAAKLETVLTNRDVKKINLELAELDLEKSKIKSLLTGVIKSKQIEKGELVNRGQILFEIVDIDQVLALISIPEKEVRFVTPGKEVKVRLEAIPGRVFTGRVHTLGVEADLKNRSFPAEILINNQKRQLLPGMAVSIEMVTSAEPNEIIIPRYAVLEREGNQVVFIEKEGVAIERPIILGTIVKDEIQVRSGLQSGDKLITLGQHFLTDKEVIKVVKNFKQKN